MKCRKHNPIRIFPTIWDVKKDKAIEFACMSITEDTSYVICHECGMIAHPIKSRRGGFRWHTHGDERYKQILLTSAKKMWSLCESKPTNDLQKFLTPA